MVWKDFFFVMNYLSTIPTSVDDLEFFLQVTKSLDHLRGEEAEDTFSGTHGTPDAHNSMYTS